MPSCRERAILPLPEEVVARIKSSTAIVSLTGVVSGLLKNSLDAKATKIEATVDFARGGCSVEDNGLGIAPSEFREDGGLGKLYCTSKYYSGEACLGRNGTFFASLAAMCLLTITSRHHDHRSHNLATFHHSKVIDRQLPAPPQHEIHEKHGTRVTVRNLFGNLPVRVKQRAAVAEHKVEHGRLWEVFKREVTGLLLSWRGEVSLRIRDADGRTSLSFSSATRTEMARPRSSELYTMLNVLTQANYILIDEWPSWVPAAASTSTLSINGAISLDLAPSKRLQFISLGIRPLSAESGHNELYDEVNRIFSLSSFGTTEDDANVDEHEKIRRQNDKQFKSDGYTNRQLIARKGVDRYPMFHLRISLKDGHGSEKSEDQLIEDDTTLQAVMEVLNAMITQWLSVHHFRPRKPRTRRKPQTPPPTSNEYALGQCSSESDSQSPPGPRVIHALSSAISSRSSDPAELRSRKRKRSKPSVAKQTLERSHTLVFAEWTRIKSSKPDFLDTLGARGKGIDQENANRFSSDLVDSALASAAPQPANNVVEFDIEPVLPGSLGGPREPPHPTDKRPCSNEENYDNTLTWMDPSTKQTFLLNARTGCVLPHPPTRPLSDPSIRRREGTLYDFNKRLRLQRKPATSGESSTPWLNDVLVTWDNPVFKPIEKGIQQVSFHENQLDYRNHRHGNHLGCSRVQIDKSFNGSSSSSISKLSKTGLQNAQVLAQLDKKFILAKMQNSTEASSNLESATEVLVLIDQHAADERIRVEALFTELCAPLPKDHANLGYHSKLGHRSRIHFAILEKPIQFAISDQERAHFMAHAAKFAAWGILFNIESSKGASERQQSVLSVATLASAVSERCKADPQVLINLLRSAVWKYADAPSSVSLFNNASTNEEEDSASWVRRLSACPEGLIDLINSRACRSAIMFNDELGMDECQELVQNLSKCVFPFMCAHGRPSMVPIVELGAVGDAGLGFDESRASADSQSAKGDFVQAWKAWKRT